MRSAWAFGWCSAAASHPGHLSAQLTVADGRPRGWNGLSCAVVAVGGLALLLSWRTVLAAVAVLVVGLGAGGIGAAVARSAPAAGTTARALLRFRLNLPVNAASQRRVRRPRSRSGPATVSEARSARRGRDGRA